jgi:hypothetical protein
MLGLVERSGWGNVEGSRVAGVVEGGRVRSGGGVRRGRGRRVDGVDRIGTVLRYAKHIN